MPAQRTQSSGRRRCPRACSTCKRRKERCDGLEPCGRCVSRSMAAHCTYSIRSPLPILNQGSIDYCEPNRGRRSLQADSLSRPFLQPALGPSRTTQIPQESRLIQYGQGNALYVGNTANLSFLQTIQRLVENKPWAASFVDEPLQHIMVEASLGDRPNWIVELVRQPPQRPSPADAKYFIRWYILATNCVLSLFQESELYDSLSAWLQNGQEALEQDPMSATFFLLFAIGAQTCPEDCDGLAERYFGYGRFLAMSGAIEDPTVSTVRTSVLITIYLLGASQQNAAFMYLGTAVRATHALGINRSDVNMLFDHTEYILRERLWKAIHVLDVFMSASLGRPPSTYETRDTKADVNYSATNDLCAIFETILTHVYSKPIVSTQIVDDISEHHRQWTAKLTGGLAVDDIQPSELIDGEGGKKVPNIGLCHLKEAYYATTMLLARPFLVESVSRNMAQRAAATGLKDKNTSSSACGQVFAHACVDSAIRTADLLHGLMSAGEVPKRLPFVVSSLFHAGLVLGLAHLGDLDGMFPVEKSLGHVQNLLVFFGRHDAAASQIATTMGKLQAVCSSYLEHRTREAMARQSQLTRGLFGSLHMRPQLHTGSSQQPYRQATHGSSQAHKRPFTPRAPLDRQSRIGPGDHTVIPESQMVMNAEDEILELLPDYTFMTDPVLSISPITSMFDNWNYNTPSLSSLDPNCSADPDLYGFWEF
ncbi:hypothetical protein FZEAL_10063 [Fusarium zealandicum]|uniref:Zn(2)-C6 fungal-type domain-containing protein n=1 Tax=Fusarium zealandicum TaxID=1053134 RepID=A0A8H4U5S9_9HYPO|nr:hypothetical protein FZEAL_10063 [Fusarium zealandicum]